MMTGRLRALVGDCWYGREPRVAARLLGVALGPAEIAFRAGVSLGRRRHDRAHPAIASIPVVSVGNLTVGGTGKTPVVRWLGDWLRRRGAQPAVVVRGYGGDEVALYRRWFGDEAVFAGVDRRAGVRAAGESGYRLALLDDGFQHRKLGRALDILLVAAEDPWRVRMLPRGPYREPLAAAGRATHLLVTSRAAGARASRAWVERLSRVAPRVPVRNLEMTMGEWRSLAGGSARPPREDVLAVCSIARPRYFAAGLHELLPGSRVEVVAYPDHHEYTAEDVAALLGRRDGRAIVCTEKDAVKLARYRGLAAHAVSVGLRVNGEPGGELLAALRDLVRRL